MLLITIIVRVHALSLPVIKAEFPKYGDFFMLDRLQVYVFLHAENFGKAFLSSGRIVFIIMHFALSLDDPNPKSLRMVQASSAKVCSLNVQLWMIERSMRGLSSASSSST